MLLDASNLLAWAVPTTAEPHTCGLVLNGLPDRIFAKLVCPRKKGKADVAQNTRRLNFARGALRRRLTKDVPGRRPTAVGRLPRDARSSRASCDASSRASEGTRASTPICRRRIHSSAVAAMALASARRMRRQRLKRASWRLRQLHGARRQCQEAPSVRLQQRSGSQHQASRTPAGASGEAPCRDASDEAAPGGAAAC